MELNLQTHSDERFFDHSAEELLLGFLVASNHYRRLCQVIASHCRRHSTAPIGYFLAYQYTRNCIQAESTWTKSLVKLDANRFSMNTPASLNIPLGSCCELYHRSTLQTLILICRYISYNFPFWLKTWLDLLSNGFFRCLSIAYIWKVRVIYWRKHWKRRSGAETKSNSKFRRNRQWGNRERGSEREERSRNFESDFVSALLGRRFKSSCKKTTMISLIPYFSGTTPLRNPSECAFLMIGQGYSIVLSYWAATGMISSVTNLRTESRRATWSGVNSGRNFVFLKFVKKKSHQNWDRCQLERQRRNRPFWRRLDQARGYDPHSLCSTA